MKNKKVPLAFSAVLLIFFLSLPIYAAGKISEAEALKMATDAYIYGYPLVTMDLSRQVMTNVEKPTESRAPMGQFRNMQTYPDAAFHDVTAPNADTLYSFAWINVSKEPYILHVPNEEGRYYLIPMLSGWTDVISSPGTRTTGTTAHDFAITGPGWHGLLPPGITEIKSPTDMVWILGRTYCSGTPEDYAAVHQIQSQYTLVPLSAFGKPYTPPDGKVNPSIDMKTPVRDQVNALDAPAFFDRLAMLLKQNPPAAADAPMVSILMKLGIIPGQHFDINTMPTEFAKGVRDAIKVGQQKMLDHMSKAGVVKNNWTFTTNTGQYGTDYLQRALIAEIGLGANLPQDAIYPVTLIDSKGDKLNGANNYVIHFAKDEMPPVKGFWSLTMYNDKFFFAENLLNRYALSPRDHLKTNADGSIDLYIQHNSPGKDKESNWLPAPTGNFILMFRFYWPDKNLIEGQWNPPLVNKTK